MYLFLFLKYRILLTSSLFKNGDFKLSCKKTCCLTGVKNSEHCETESTWNGGEGQYKKGGEIDSQEEKPFLEKNLLNFLNLARKRLFACTRELKRSGW